MNLHVAESVNETHVRVLTKGRKFKKFRKILRTY